MQAILDYINDNFMHFRNAVKLQLFCSGGLGMIIVIFQLLPLKKIILFEKKISGVQNSDEIFEFLRFRIYNDYLCKRITKFENCKV